MVVGVLLAMGQRDFKRLFSLFIYSVRSGMCFLGIGFGNSVRDFRWGVSFV